MEGIKNFLLFLESNWTNILVIIGLVLIIIKKTISFINLSTEEKKEAALKIIKEELLKLMSDAEIYWSSYEKSGQIKKADVISKIYAEFPILTKVVDQASLLEEIDSMITETKEQMDEIINNETYITEESEG